MKTPNSRGGWQKQDELEEQEKKQKDGEVQEHVFGQEHHKRKIVVNRMLGTFHIGKALNRRREHSRGKRLSHSGGMMPTCGPIKERTIPPIIVKMMLK